MGALPTSTLASGLVTYEITPLQPADQRIAATAHWPYHRYMNGLLAALVTVGIVVPIGALMVWVQHRSEQRASKKYWSTRGGTAAGGAAAGGGYIGGSGGCSGSSHGGGHGCGGGHSGCGGGSSCGGGGCGGGGS